MHSTALNCLVVLLLCNAQYSQGQPVTEDYGDPVPGNQASTGHVLDANEEDSFINNVWADLVYNQLKDNEYQTVAMECKELILHHRRRISNRMRFSIEELNKEKFTSVTETRNIVSKAMTEWAYHLDTLVRGLRRELLLISDVFITYFKLMVARCEIYSPTSAAKFKAMLDQILSDEKLLDLDGQGHSPSVLVINNAVRYFSGTFNPAQEFSEQLKALERGATLDEGKFDEYLTDARVQIETIGLMVLDMVDAMEETSYLGLKLYLECMRIFKTHKAIFTTPAFFERRDSVADVKEHNDQIKVGLRLVKNLKAVEIMFGQRPLAATIGDTGISTVSNTGDVWS